MIEPRMTLPPVLPILTVAVAAPLIAEATRRVGVPVVVLEVLLGVTIGPQGLGWAASEGAIPFLATLGFAFLFFLAGLEIDLHGIQGRPLRLAAAGWAVGMLLACAIGIGLRASGLVQAWLVVATALMTTALGVLIPVLRDSGGLETPFGRCVVAAGVMGELGPILTMSLALSSRNSAPVQTLFTVAFVAVVLGAAWLLLRGRDVPGFLGLLRRTMTQSSQLPVRIAILILVALTVLAEALGLDLALGALAAGMVIAAASRGLDVHVLELKLDAIGFGFLAPIFFINSGMKLDVESAFGTGSGLLLAGLFFVGVIVTRIPLMLLFRRELGRRRAVALGIYAGATLGLVVALTEIGVKSESMTEADAASLIGGAMLSMLLFPALGLRVSGAHASPGPPIDDRF
jgi:Kef-type K+ transport system membrane component KefB